MDILLEQREIKYFIWNSEVKMKIKKSLFLLKFDQY